MLKCNFIQDKIIWTLREKVCFHHENDEWLFEYRAHFQLSLSVTVSVRSIA